MSFLNVLCGVFDNINICVYISTFFIGILLLIIGKIITDYRKFSVVNRIPGPKTSFLLGNALDFFGGPSELFETVVNKICRYPEGLSRIWIMNKPIVLIYGASGMEALLSNSRNLQKGSDYNFLHLWLGQGLLTSSGSKWHTRRKMLTPAFHFKILEEFVEIFNRQSVKFVNKLEKYLNGDKFDIFPIITLSSLDIILETTMGRDINILDNPQTEYVKAIYDMGRILMIRFARPWLQYDFILNLTELGRLQKKSLKILHDFSMETIRERKAIYKELKSQKKEENTEDEVIGKKKRQAFLDLLIEYSEQNGNLTEDDIREEVDTFMFEGHDTTSSSIHWTIYLLGRHPNIQEKVYDELESIFGKEDVRPATSTDVREMNYLECCIKESLRLMPSVPFFTRCLAEDLHIDGYVIPKGMDVSVIVFNLHRDPKHFPDPLSFKPERFFPEASSKRNPYAYIPFSAGPRNCIGQKFAMIEEKIVISTFLRKYRVESLDKIEDLKLSSDLVLRPQSEMSFKIFPRNEH